MLDIDRPALLERCFWFSASNLNWRVHLVEDFGQLHLVPSIGRLHLKLPDDFLPTGSFVSQGPWRAIKLLEFAERFLVSRLFRIQVDVVLSVVLGPIWEV